MSLIGSLDGFKRRLFIVITFLILILATFLVGQVLGSYYLANIKGNSVMEIVYNKKKVLKLKQIDYYTILLASYDDQKKAISLEKAFSEKNIPVVITDNSPYCILLGFVNNSESLQVLAEKILVDNKKAVVVNRQINEVCFKFDASDTYAEKELAPFLGKVSMCLEKGVIINSGISIQMDSVKRYQKKFPQLAKELEEIALEGISISQDTHNVTYNEEIKGIASSCQEWANSLRQLEENWSDENLLISQQKALALLSDYHHYLSNS